MEESPIGNTRRGQAASRQSLSSHTLLTPRLIKHYAIPKELQFRQETACPSDREFVQSTATLTQLTSRETL